MSRRRKMTPSWGEGKQPKGPSGRGLCFWCGKEVPKRRRNWCSDECYSEYRKRTEANYQAHLLLERDAGVCAICGINADIVAAEYRQKKVVLQKKEYASYYIGIDRHGNPTYCWAYHAREDIEKLNKEYKEQGWHPQNYSRWWQIDHILPVAEGGGPDEWPRERDYLENLRTLCIPCHKKETRALRARLKEKKNGQKQLPEKKS